MNIVQQHIGVKARLDEIGSPRFQPFQIDHALDTAALELLHEKMSGSIEFGKRNSFQKTQVLRDELYTLIRKISDTDTPAITIAGKKIQGLPSSAGNIYRHLLLLKITINTSLSDYCIPIQYDKKPELFKNPYLRPQNTYPYKFYFMEISDGFECFTANVADVINHAEIEYIAQPINVNYGTLRNPTYTFNKGSCICVTACTINNVVYAEGTELTPETGHQLTSGTVVTQYTNSNMPIALHDEIVNRAAKQLILDTENYEKWKSIEEKNQLEKK